VDLHVAQYACLLLGRLLCSHYRKTSRWRGAEVGRGMALQALQVDVAVLQHMRICPSVRDMAGRASFNPHGSVFECEWSLLVLVALETDETPGV